MRVYRIRPEEDKALKAHIKNNPDKSESGMLRSFIRSLPEFKERKKNE